jgi:ParB family chromosome partitioning protein
VKKLVSDGAISAGHARALLGVPDPERVAKRIVEKGLTVRDVERLGQETTPESRPAAAGRKGAPGADADTRALEKTLTDALGMKVEIRHRGESGEVRVRYESLDQLDAICRRLSE